MWYVMVFRDERKTECVKVMEFATIKNASKVLGLKPQVVSNSIITSSKRATPCDISRCSRISQKRILPVVWSSRNWEDPPPLL